MTLPTRVKEVWESFLGTALEFVVHLLILILLLLGFRLIHWFYLLLHPQDPPILFGVTMTQIFQFFDLLLIVGILGLGVWKVLRAYIR